MKKNAIIMAAGYGMRMVPINTTVPKGLIEVNGEPLIERTIRQLQEGGIEEIYIVVGYMKEKYEYLRKKYPIHLVENAEYAEKNNLHTLKCVLDHISNTYIIPCDIWCKENPYHKDEEESWYMVSDYIDDESTVRINRKMELITTASSMAGNAMIGICFLNEEMACTVKNRICRFCTDKKYDNAFWEQSLYHNGKMLLKAKVVHCTDVVEINTYEQLREIDSNSNQLQTEAIDVICNALGVDEANITNIKVLKKGMTNRSFVFSCKGRTYIMRIPGEGTDRLIDRQQEAAVYSAIKGKNISDDIAYINAQNGYKIAEFLQNARVCDSADKNDVRECMRYLRNFHEQKFVVDHEFDIIGQIEFYESLWEEKPSIYRDYKSTKKNVISLHNYIKTCENLKVLTHIDAVPDNFLFVGKDGKEEIRLIDWEYAGMQDPHVDIAMFCIYSLYNKRQVDRVISDYFTEGCDVRTRIKIYCYISMCGLLWSNWCEYKRNLGVDFGEYALKQYQYAKKYYKIVQKELEKLGG